jgi:hypothetical protein
MAESKSKKAQDRAVRRTRLTRDQYMDFTANSAALRAELDEASTAHAGYFKRGDSIGVHLEAAKLSMKLDKMEPTKRADFLRAFDLYREWYEEWTVQGDLLDTADEDAGDYGQAQDYAAGADETAEADAAEAAVAPAEAGEVNAPEPVVGTVEADFGDDKPLTPPAELEGAGYTFETGVAAGRDGAPLESNPHIVTHPSHLIWARGHAKGVKDAAAQENAVDADAPGVEQEEAAPKGRRKPRGSQETAAETVLH